MWLPLACEFEDVTKMQQYEGNRFFPEISESVFVEVVKSTLAFGSENPQYDIPSRWASIGLRLV